MATVRILKTVFQRADLVITGEITIEVTFSETDVQNNIGYIPMVFLRPCRSTTDWVTLSGASLTDASIAAGMKTVTLSDVTNEVAARCKGTVQPDGKTTVVTTITPAVGVNELFREGPSAANAQEKAQRYFSIPAYIDARVEMLSEISSSSHRVINQMATQ